MHGALLLELDELLELDDNRELDELLGAEELLLECEGPLLVLDSDEPEEPLDAELPEDCDERLLCELALGSALRRSKRSAPKCAIYRPVGSRTGAPV